MIFDAALRQGTPVKDGDVVVVTQKIVSKAEGRLVNLDTVKPSAHAIQLSGDIDKDPRLLELILQESRELVRVDSSRGILITETNHGFVCANAGIDTSNVPGDNVVCLLPEDSDRSADVIRADLSGLLSKSQIAVLVSDTFGRGWRNGQVDFAIGVSGMESIKDYRGTYDSFMRILNVTRIAVADEVAAAAEMVTGKADRIPAAIVRGLSFSPGLGRSTDLIREKSKDLFR
jgi:coenzyme F420-0:L-glutamate ligase/coenzyme F420-1:gamma-L-glutamate ligase